MPPLVSILIPAYNSQRWLAATVESALRQTWPRREVIIVDDGSRDQTLDVARRFASREVQVVSQPNRGAAAARNKAYSLCQGDYIQWLDADDLLAPDKIEQQMRVRCDGAAKRTLLTSAWGSFAHRPGKAVFSPTALWETLSPLEWMLRSMEQNIYMQTTAWLVSRELTDAAGPWNESLSLDDDGEYFFRVIMASNEVRFVPESRAFYRRLFSGNLSNLDCSPRKWESQFKSIQLHIRHLLSIDDSERARTTCVRYLQDWAFFFCPERLDLFEKMREMAAGAGGQLEVPSLPWKYAWAQRAFGWKTARRLSALLPKLRWSMTVSWDKLLARFERQPV